MFTMKQFIARRGLLPLAAVALLGAGGLLASVPAHAATMELTAKLIPENGAPPTGLGYVTVEYDAATLMLKWHITYSGLTGPVMAAHFHGPATPGTDAPPIIPIAPSLSPIDAATKLTLDQVSQLLGGLYYVNLHTQAFPNGEIRGQVNVQP